MSGPMTIEVESSELPLVKIAGGLSKSPTGIAGLDEITGGGLPMGRSTLVCGPPGCGKTMMSVEFLVHGIIDYGETGVFLSFEESPRDLVMNAVSMGFDLAQHERDGHLAIEHLNIYESVPQFVSSTRPLDTLLVRLGAAIDRLGAKRVVIDTMDTLFGLLTDSTVRRAELRRLFKWLRERGVTTMITGERGDGDLTRDGIEEYVSDCVIVLDQRVTEQTSIRRLRILKYRGSAHGTNEFPFLIGASGFSVLPITSAVAASAAMTEHTSIGNAGIDEMIGGEGPYRGSTILVSGGTGAGKSTMAAQFCVATCERGERALYVSFEESDEELIRNMSSVGIDLRRWADSGLLQFHCSRPTLFGLEAHLFSLQNLVTSFNPDSVVLDPISDLSRIGTSTDVKAMLIRIIRFLKARGSTTLCTRLEGRGETSGVIDDLLDSIIDAWIVVNTTDGNGERNRTLSVVKSRGMANSNQIREFLLTDQGIVLPDVYVGAERNLTGSARQAQQADEDLRDIARLDEVAQRRLSLERKRVSLEARIADQWREYQDEADIVSRFSDLGEMSADQRAHQRIEQKRMRGN